jgi:hypothetical protein
VYECVCKSVCWYGQSDAESRRRKLRLRTYAVLPMTEECGIIEWVPNTTGFRHLVNAQHEKVFHFFSITHHIITYHLHITFF